MEVKLEWVLMVSEEPIFVHNQEGPWLRLERTCVSGRGERNFMPCGATREKALFTMPTDRTFFFFLGFRLLVQSPLEAHQDNIENKIDL